MYTYSIIYFTKSLSNIFKKVNGVKYLGNEGVYIYIYISSFVSRNFFIGLLLLVFRREKLAYVRTYTGAFSDDHGHRSIRACFNIHTGEDLYLDFRRNFNFGLRRFSN